MSDQYFKNVQVLKGIPVNEFMETMGFFAASLGLNCVFCHVPESLENWDKFAEDVPLKRRSRQMIEMVNTINKTQFGGRRALTCYSCHRGNQVPKVIPSLAEQYGVPAEDPNQIEIVPGRASRTHRRSNFGQIHSGDRRLTKVGQHHQLANREGHL